MSESSTEGVKKIEIERSGARPTLHSVQRKEWSKMDSATSIDHDIHVAMESAISKSDSDEEEPSQLVQKVFDTIMSDHDDDDDAAAAAEVTAEESPSTTTEYATPEMTLQREWVTSDENVISSEHTEEENESSEHSYDTPMGMLRKGAVAAVGGTLVGVGLVMIPLPTPFGAVVASSGLAVLGTEFEGAKEMNERLVDGTKETLHTAREKIQETMESIEQQRQVQKEKIRQELEAKEKHPLFMNEAERQRQETQKEKQKDLIASAADTYEEFKRRAGSYLTKGFVPLLKKENQTNSSHETPNEDSATIEAESVSCEEPAEPEKKAEEDWRPRGYDSDSTCEPVVVD